VVLSLPRTQENVNDTWCEGVQLKGCSGGLVESQDNNPSQTNGSFGVAQRQHRGSRGVLLKLREVVAGAFLRLSGKDGIPKFIRWGKRRLGDGENSCQSWVEDHSL